MTQAELRNRVVASVLACMVAVAVATGFIAVSLSNFSNTPGLGSWYFRLNALDLSTEMLALGAIGYALPPHRLTTLALRVAAALGVIGVATEVLEWIAAFDAPYARASGGAGARAVAHLAELAVCGAVIAAWYVTERASRTNDA